ncbi:hypothetical protein JCM6882_006439 [Rhodosporidiobolus microsporus]
MSGWDNYVDPTSGGTSGGGAGAGAGIRIPVQGFEDGAVYQPGTTDDGSDPSSTSPIFTLGQVQFTLPSALFALSCTNNVLLLACTGAPPPSSSSSSSSSRNPAAPSLPPQIIRIDLDAPTEVETISLPLPPHSSSAPSSSQPPPPRLHALHVDPLGRHALVSTTTGENFYLFVGALPASSARKAKPLPRLKGAIIDSVAWAPSSGPSSSISSSSTTSSSPFATKDLLLGTSTGQLLSTSLLDAALLPDAQQQSAFSLPVPGARTGGVEKYVKQLLTLPVREGIVGVRYETWPAAGGEARGAGGGGGRGRGQKKVNVAVAAATRTRVYQFVGTVAVAAQRKGEEGAKEKGDEQLVGQWIEEVIRPYAAGDVRPKTLELPSDAAASELHFFAPPVVPASSGSKAPTPTLGLPQTLAWMTGPGIYHAHLSFPPSDLPAGEGIIDTASLIPYPSFPSSLSSSNDEGIDAPLSMALTEHHFVLLYRERVVAVDILTDLVVYSEALNLPPHVSPLRLSTDPLSRTLWLHTSESIFELVVRDEDRDVWRVWLKRGEWERAKRAAKTPLHRSLILSAEASSHFAAGRFIPAAQAYAQITDAAVAPFEEVVLRFVERGERDALRYFLGERLGGLRKTDLTQRALLSTWLVELFLAKLNELEDLAAAVPASTSADGGAMNEEKGNFEVERVMVEEDVRDFLKRYKDALDPRTTISLLTQHGRDDLTLFFAGVVGDHERVVQYHVGRGEWKMALGALGKQDNLELYYRFAFVLVRHAPKEAIDAFLRQPRLSPRRLIPALTAPRLPSPSSPAPDATASAAEHAIRYLLHVVEQQGNTDPGVHNALVTLFATSSSSSSSDSSTEPAFVRFLETAPVHPHTLQPYFNLDYALRLCRSASPRLTQACVVIYSRMGLYDESVDLALEQDDLELAKACADRPLLDEGGGGGDGDELLRKKLWLKVAKHVVGKKNDIKTAMRFLESTPLLKIEDILPFFPDFVVIDDFKDEICDALESYAAHIEQLKSDMADATKAADAIRGDIAELDDRFVVVDAKEKCGACGGQLLTRQFYVFPCQHCFHADCLIQEVTKTLSPTQLRRMLDLQAQLAPSSSTRHSHRHRTPAAPTPSSPSPAAAAAANAARRATALLDESAAAGGAGLKLAAQASVQAVDQLRKLVLPDALLSAIGGAIPLPAVPGVNGGARVRLGANGRAVSGSAAMGGAAAVDAASLKQSASAKREAKEKMALREQLDELLARECVLCEGGIKSIERGFVEEGEEM